jgi:hypothetical protein
MATYQINGNQATVSTGAKSTMACWAITATLKRIKIYEFDVGATGVPNASDCNITIQLNRLTYTSLIVGTAYTPTATDAADGAAVTVSNVNVTTEPAANSVTTASPLYVNGMNQRNTIRWVAAQESQYFISAATNLVGWDMTVLSPSYASSCSANVYILE